MKKEKILIQGVEFEKVKNLQLKTCFELKGIYQAYEKPSMKKVSIYHNWYEFTEKLDLVNSAYYGIASYNSNIFTFDFCFKYESKKYYAHITPSHNYICEVE